jgi:hypothetical protein
MSWSIRPGAVFQISSRWNISLILAIFINSLQISAFLTYMVSVIPMYTVPVTGVLFSRTPCQFHIWISYASISIWMFATTFAEHRFQVSLDSRRSGLWSSVIDHPSSKATGTLGSAKETGAWKVDHVYSKGDTAAISVSSSLDFIRLDSYGSVCKNAPSNTNLVHIGVSGAIGRGYLSLKSEFQRIIFTLCAKEVGRIESSSILRVLFVMSSCLSSFLAFSTLISPKVKIVTFLKIASGSLFIFIFCRATLDF